MKFINDSKLNIWDVVKYETEKCLKCFVINSMSWVNNQSIINENIIINKRFISKEVKIKNVFIFNLKNM